VKATDYYMAIWILEELYQSFVKLDELMDEALCKKDRNRYLEIVKNKATALIEAANQVFLTTGNGSEKERRIWEKMCHWVYMANKFLASPQKTYDVEEILTQQGKDQIRFYAKLRS
jgi:hypothetical protein